MAAALDAAAARPYGGANSQQGPAAPLGANNHTHARNLPVHTPLSSVLAQFKEAEASWAHEKVRGRDRPRVW